MSDHREPSSRPCPQTMLDLIGRFELHADAYRRQEYNETQVRREFIDPLFKALGWDVDNESGHAETYKDVIHEDAIKVGGSTKAPDYCFRIGGVRKFFVEAKKPSVSVGDDPAPAYQLRRYAWTAKLPLSILTDFEEFAVYDCRIKPRPDDKTSTARVLYLKCDEYPKRWDEIASIFSKDAILKGSFDKYAESNKRKRGTAEVDDEFLKEIESWRDELARNIALRNPQLTVRELNYAVGKTIDRIIFLRMCEDRGVETYAQLRLLLNGPRVYLRLVEIFHRADERYNSGLFHFEQEKNRHDEPDTLTPNLSIDDRVLKDIIKGLYYPDCPYEFSVMPPEILGQVYEQFLGKVIRLTKGHQAVVEEKPEVKKAGGVYYTPKYIVDYIVEHTVGELLKEAGTPAKAEKLRLLDPACGSGSFLLGAYQTLLDWHLRWYIDNDPEKHAKKKNPPIYQSGSRGWQLTIAEKKRILLNNIYGVDIDPQAVEVTKLSLLLKVLEGESAETIGQTLRMFHERALPDLADNIKCGNSLIGPDFYDNQQLTLLDEEERYRINVFDWHTEFPDIMRGGGFDAVIGNPPYGYQIARPEQQYFERVYKHQDYQKDLYLLFLERYSFLLHPRALLGVIVSNTWLQSVKLRSVRAYLASSFKWMRVLCLPEKVFRAIVDTHVLVFQRSDGGMRSSDEALVEQREAHGTRILQRLSGALIPPNGDPINVVASHAAQRMIERVRQCSVRLAEVCSVFNGIKPFEKGKGQPPQTDVIVQSKPFVREGARPDSSWSPLLRGALIGRYEIRWNEDYWIRYGPWLAAPRDTRIFDALSKIMVRQTGDSIIATFVGPQIFARNNLHIVLPKDPRYDLRFVLGVLNSRVMDFVYTCMNPEKGEALAEVKKHHVEALPLPSLEQSSTKLGAPNNRLVDLVERMLDLHKQLAAAKSPTDKTAIQRQIDATDRQIDQLVYELYGLTDDEIRIVEEATQG